MSLSKPSPSSSSLDKDRLDAHPVPWMHGAAGVMGGAFSMTMFYPLDLIRTRLHAEKGQATRQGLISVREMVRQRGVGCLFQGVKVAVLAHSVGWGLYLTLFRSVQQPLARQYGSSSLGDFVAACTAAVTTGLLVTPLNVMKTRAQLKSADESHLKEKVGPTMAEEQKAKKTRGLVAGMRNIVKHQGVSGLFRGAGPQILLSMHTTIQVGLYEVIKRRMGWDNPTCAPPMLGVACASAVSKAVAATVCNPLEVCRTRLQDKRNASDPNYASFGRCFRTIWVNEGMRGLYRGVTVNVCRVVPTTVVAFVMYERCLLAVHYVSVATRGRVADVASS